MKKILSFLIFAVFSSFTFAQSAASINSDFEIKVQDSNNKIPEYASVDLSSIPFASQESLDKFCSVFSMPHHQLNGNLSNNELRIHFNQSFLAQKNIDLTALNEHFLTLAKRMQIVYNNL